MSSLLHVSLNLLLERKKIQHPDTFFFLYDTCGVSSSGSSSSFVWQSGSRGGDVPRRRSNRGPKAGSHTEPGRAGTGAQPGLCGDAADILSDLGTLTTQARYSRRCCGRPTAVDRCLLHYWVFLNIRIIVVFPPVRHFRELPSKLCKIIKERHAQPPLPYLDYTTARRNYYLFIDEFSMCCVLRSLVLT